MSERTLVVDLAASRLRCRCPVRACLSVDGPRQRLAFHRSETTAAALISAVSSVAEVVDLGIEEPDIEAVIRRVYAGDLTL